MKLMALRYAGNCAGCGIRIEQRTTAWFDSQAKNVTCTACRPVQDEPAVGWAAPSSESRTPMRSARTDLEKGAELEQKVAAVFAANGYRVQTNVIREDRDGLRHEIDVLAEKTDELLTLSVAVECKAWSGPVDKEIVLKIDEVRRRLGIGHGVVVSLNGMRPGAQTVADEKGIVVWGPDQIEPILGRASVQGLQNRPMVKEVGFPRLTATHGAQLLAHADTTGVFGLGREEIIWSADVWIPVSVVQLTLMKQSLRRQNHTTQMWGIYDLIGATFVTRLDSEPPRTPVELDGERVKPMLKVVDPARALDKIIAAHASVKSDEARKKHRDRLTAFGIPEQHTATTGPATPFLYPLHLTLARRRNAERIIVVDSFRSKVDGDLGTILSKNITWVRECLGTSSSVH